MDYINEADGAENIFYVAPKDSRGNMLPASELSANMLDVDIEYDAASSRTSNMDAVVSHTVEADGRFKVVYVITEKLEEDSEYKRVKINAKVNGETIMVDREGGEEGLEKLNGLSVIQGRR